MKCSTLFVVLIGVLVLFSGAAYGQTSTANLVSVSGTIGSDGPDADTFPDSIKTDTNIVFTIRYTNSTGFAMVGATNGWTVYSPDGADWDSTKLDTLALTGPGWLARSDLAFGFYPLDTPNFDDPPSEGTDSNGFVANGAAPDTVGLSLVSNTNPHFENGFNQNAVTITLKAINATHNGKHVCLDTSVYDVAANAWLWALTGGGSSIPIWGGPFCFTIFDDISTGISESDTDLLPTKFELEQNFPNPFNPTTSIKFALPTKSYVSVNVYNLLGQEIAILVDQELPAGTYTAEWDGRDKNNTEVASGIYFYKLVAGDFIDTKKMMLVK